MRDIEVHPRETSPKISVMRFGGSLYFANAGPLCLRRIARFGLTSDGHSIMDRGFPGLPV
ncbi:MAG: hypothetical protein LJE91_05070 [Gammaproteobacteria bacterium]|jgi:hypothetical protein|nr:hypothetical protein [Gammaproteobacteria bacterium]